MRNAIEDPSGLTTRWNGTHVCIATYSDSDEAIAFWEVHSNAQKINVQKQDTMSRRLIGGRPRKILWHQTGSWFALLLKAGSLSLWDTKCCVRFADYGCSNVIDFVHLDIVTKAAAKHASEPLFALVGTKGTIKVIALRKRSFQTIYTNDTFVASGMGSICNSKDNGGCFYLVGMSPSKDVSAPCKLSLWVSESSSPNHNLKDLVEAGKFSEALQFAREQNLNEATIYQAQCRSLLEQLSQADCCLETIWSDFVRVVEMLKEHDFIVRACIETRCSKAECVTKLLGYAMKRCYQTPDSDKILESTRKQCNTATARWKTFQLINEQKYTAAAWDSFRSSQPLTILAMLFKDARMQAAATFWRRHRSTTVDSLELIRVLEQIPVSIKPSTYAQWIHDELVPTFQMDATLQVRAWACKRAAKIEQVHSSATEALVLVKSVACQWSDVPRTYRSPSALVESIRLASRESLQLDHSSTGEAEEASFGNANLRRLERDLEEIIYLSSEREVKLSLSEYRKHTIGTIANTMLDRVSAPELLVDEIRVHLKPYLIRHCIALDQTLVNYISHIVNIQTSATLSSIAQRRSMAIIGCILDVELRSTATLNLLRHLRPPFMSDVLELIEDALTWGGREHAKIQEQQRLMHLYEIFARYNVDTSIFNVSDKSHVRSLLRHILSQVHSPSALTDALCLADAYADLNKSCVYVDFLENTIISRCQYGAMPIMISEALENAAETSSRCLEILQSIPHDMVRDVVNEVLTFCVDLLHEETLQLPTEFPSNRDNRGMLLDTAKHQAMSATMVACDLLEYSLCHFKVGEHGNSQRQQAQACDLLRSLNRIKTLQKNFSLFFGVKSLRSNEAVRMAIDWGISCVVEKKISARQLMQLAALLCQNEQHLLGKLAVGYIEAQQWHMTKRFSDKLQNSRSNSISAQAIQSIAIAMMRAVASEDLSAKNALSTRIQVATSALELLQFSIRICAAEDLSKSMELVRSIDMLVRMLYKTEFGDESIEAAWGEASSATMLGNQKYCPISPSRFELRVSFVSNTYGFLFSSVLMSVDDTIFSHMFATFAHSFYNDHGLVIDSGRSLEVGAGFVFSVVENQTIERQFVTASKLVKFLIENGADQLAFNALNCFFANSATCVYRLGTVSEKLMTMMKNQGKQFLTTVLKGLVGKMLLADSLDCQLSVGCIISFPTEFVGIPQLSKEALRSYGTYNRRLSLLSIMVGACRQRWPTLLPAYEEIRRQTTWWCKLENHSILFDHHHCQRNAMRYVKSLIPRMFAGGMPLDEVKSFCDVFKEVTPEFITMSYVTFLCSDSNLTESELFNQLLQAFRSSGMTGLDCKECICNRILPQINGTDYPRLRLLLSLVPTLSNSFADGNQSDPVADLGLTEIQDKCRVLDILRDCALSRCTEIRAINFHELVEQPWEVIQGVLSESSLMHLVTLSTPLQLDPDQFYICLLRRTLTSFEEERAEDTDGADLDSETIVDMGKYSAITLNLRRIAKHELAAKQARWVSEIVPLSKFKIDVLLIARERAEEYLDSVRSDPFKQSQAQRFLTALANSERDTRTKYALRVLQPYYNIGLQSPKKLIFDLYHNFAAWALNKCTSNGTPFHVDIHTLVWKIGERHGIEQAQLNQLRHELIQHWLKTGSTRDPLDYHSHDEDTISSHSSIITGSSVFVEDPEEAAQTRERDTTARIVYTLCCPFNVNKSEHWCLFLLRYAVESHPGKKFDCKARALKALFRIANNDTIQRACANIDFSNLQTILKKSPGKDGRPAYVTVLQKYLRYCIFLSTLQQMRLPFTLDHISSGDIFAVVRGLWRHYRKQPAIVLLIAQMMIDFKLTDRLLWNNVLLELWRLKCYRTLLRLLQPLSTISGLWDAKDATNLMKLWKQVLMTPLNEYRDSNVIPRSNGSKSVSQDDLKYTKTFETVVFSLTHCPFLDSICLENFVRAFVDIQHIELAIRCCMLACSVETRSQCVLVLIESGQTVALLSKISERNVNLERVVYGEVLHGHYYRSLQKSRFWSTFLTFVAAQPKIVVDQFCRSLQSVGEIEAVEKVRSQQRANDCAQTV